MNAVNLVSTKSQIIRSLDKKWMMYQDESFFILIQFIDFKLFLVLQIQTR